MWKTSSPISTEPSTLSLDMVQPVDRRRAILPITVASGALATLGCVHHPQRAELRTYDRAEAADLVCQAIRLRFESVRMTEAHLGRFQSSDAFSADESPVRSRAYVGLTPGEFGWGVEITVVREKLSSFPFAIQGPPAGWRYAGRDRKMEAFLAEALEGWLAKPQSVFEESPPSRAAAPRSR